jgi:hypothetical protein
MRPEAQGKGAAERLHRWGTGRSDKEGTKMYLKASPNRKPIYKHLGFGEVGRIGVELEGTGDGGRGFEGRRSLWRVLWLSL